MPIQSRHLVHDADLEVEHPVPDQRDDHVRDQVRQQQIAARTVIDLVSRYISIAMPIARIVCTPMLITTYSTVTTSAFQKKLSWIIRR